VVQCLSNVGISDVDYTINERKKLIVRGRITKDSADLVNLDEAFADVSTSVYVIIKKLVCS